MKKMINMMVSVLLGVAMMSSAFATDIDAPADYDMDATAYREDFAKDTAFTDVKKGQWFYEAISTLADDGYLKGYDDGSFGPNDAISKGQMAAMLVRLNGADVAEVEAGKLWAKPYIRYAFRNNWISEGEYNIMDYSDCNDDLSRKIAARALVRATGYDAYAAEYYDTTVFSDYSDIPEGNDRTKYNDYAIAAYQLGYFLGDDNGCFNAEKTLTRAEVATILYRAYYLEGEKELPMPEKVQGLHIVYVDDVSEAQRTSLVNTLCSLPDSVVESFIASGWTIYAANKDIRKVTPVQTIAAGVPILGLTKPNDKAIYIKMGTDWDERNLIHEFGHFVAYDRNLPNALGNIRNEELDNMITLTHSKYCATNTQEYLAEAFAESIQDPETMEKLVPKSYALIEKAVHNADIVYSK